MSISAKNAKIILDFDYVDEKTKKQFNIKYHHTEDWGETITISDGEEGVLLPARMFFETTDFVRSKLPLLTESGSASDKSQSNATVFSRNATTGQSAIVAQGRLPLPQIDIAGSLSKQMAEQKEKNNQEIDGQRAKLFSEASNRTLESFEGEDSGLETEEAIIENAVETNPLDGNSLSAILEASPKATIAPNEEAEAMAAQMQAARNRAVERAKTSKRSIKRAENKE